MMMIMEMMIIITVIPVINIVVVTIIVTVVISIAVVASVYIVNYTSVIKKNKKKNPALTLIRIRKENSKWAGNRNNFRVYKNKTNDWLTVLLQHKDNGFTPWPNLPNGPCYSALTYTHTNDTIMALLSISHNKLRISQKNVFFNEEEDNRS